MTGEHYTDTSDILINRKIIASRIKEIVQALDEQLYGAINGVVPHNYFRMADFSVLTIAGGIVTATGMSHTIAAESGTTDTLDTITVTPTGVQMLILKAQTGHTITVGHNTGNVKFSSGTDFALQGDKRLILFYDGSTLYDTATSASAGSASVSSVALSVPSFLLVAGSPITTSGTLAVTLATQVKNKILVGPATGSDAVPTFRLMELADLPSIADTKLLGNASGGAAVPSEITVQSPLQMSGNTLSITGGAAQGGEGEAGNVVTNGSFETWERGIAAAPDKWVLTGTNATIDRESTIVKHGTYSAKVTRVGNDCHLSYDVYANGGKTYMRGRTYVAGAWVYATLGSRARLRANDGTTTTYSAYHTGSSTWEWLTFNFVVGAGATVVNVGLAVDTGNTAAYMEGLSVVEGTTLTYPIQPALAINALPKRATMWHDEATVLAGNPLAYNVTSTLAYNVYISQGAASGALNDAFTHGFWLQGGTYTFSALGFTTTIGGQIDWYFDNVKLISVQDWYAASGVLNTVKTASVTIVGDGYHVLKGVVPSKNGSSGGYVIPLIKYWLKPSSD